MTKVKIIPHDKKDKVKAKILQAIMDDWIKDNPQMLDDIMELSMVVVSFNAKWGTKLTAEKIIDLKTKTL